MMKKLWRMIFVFSFSSLVFLMFAAASGIIRVQGAEIRPDVEIFGFREPYNAAPGSTLQRSLLGERLAHSPAAPEADVDLQAILTDFPDPVHAGSMLTYTVDILNNSPETATLVTLTDTLPLQVTLISALPSQGICTDAVCELGDLSGGGTAAVTLTVQVDPSFSGTLNNLVEVTSFDTELNPGDNTDSEATTVDLEADLAIIMLDDPDPVIAGNPLTYTLVITNLGPSDASNVTVFNDFPPSLSFISSIPGSPTCSRTGTDVDCDLGDLGAGSSTQVILFMEVKSSSTNPLDNFASVSSSTLDPDPSNNLVTENTTIIFSSDLSVTTVDDPDPVDPGGTLNYTLTVANSGPSDADGVVVTDTLPVEVSLISITPSQGTCVDTVCTLGTILAGVNANVTLVTEVDVGVTGIITNTAQVSSLDDPQPGNNIDDETTVIGEVTDLADLSITKSDFPDPVAPGELLTYTLSVVNNGPDSALNVTVTDTLPVEVSLVSITPSQGTCVGTVCTLGTILVGGDAHVTLVTEVDLGATGVITNTAQVSSLDDPLPGNNIDDETTTIDEGVDLSVAKSDTPDPATAGELLIYALTVNNLGSADAPNVVLVDTLPGEVTFISSTPGDPTCVSASGSVTCSLGTLSAGAATDVSIFVQVDPGAGGPLTNLANVSSDALDPDPTNNQAIEDTAIIFSSDLSVTTVDDPDPVYPGGILTYTLTVANSGPSEAEGVVVMDTLPVEVSLVSIAPSQGTCVGTVCTLGTILVGGDANVTLVTEVDLGATGVITNTAQVSSLDDPLPGNNIDDETTTISELIDLADLSISKSDFPDPVAPGELLTYTLSVSNNGPLSATNVTVTDTLPVEVSLLTITPSQGTCVGLVCNLGTILAGGNANVILVTAVDEGATGLIINSAQVSSLETDPLPGNNFESVTTLVSDGADLADLSITKSGSPDPVAPGALLTYTLGISNIGPLTATNVIITDTLPVTVTYVSSQPDLVCSESGGVVTCGTWNLAPTGSTAVNIIVEVDPTAQGSLVNQAQVASDVLDPVMDNNQATISTDVLASADLVVSTIDDPEPVNPGGMLTYTLTVTNNGPYVTSGVTLIDTLPAEVTLLFADPSQGSCTGTICSLGIIAAETSAQVTLVGLISLDASGVITNTAQVFGYLFDPIEDNNLDREFTTVGPGADLSLTKTASPDPVVAGEILTYSLSIHNQGPSSAPSVTLVDTLPGNVAFLSSIPAAPTCAQSAGTVACSLGSIDSDDTRNVTIVVQVDALATGVLTNQAHVSSITFDPDGANNTAVEETTIIIPDTEPPTVEWIYPVGDEQSYEVGTEVLPLEVDAIDNVGIQRVDFFWWDPEIEQFIDIGSVFDAPYRVDFDTSVLYYGYNQVYVRGYDTSGNVSNRPRILLFRLELEYVQYLPVIAR